MELRVIDEIDGFRAVAAQWNELVERSGAGLHLTSIWILAWWETFGTDADVVCLFAHDDAGPVAAIPLVFGPKRLGPVALQVCRLLGNEFCSRSDMIVLRHEVAVLDGLRDLLRRRGVAWFDCGWSPVSTGALVRAHAARWGWRCRDHLMFDLPIVDLGDDFETWLQGKSRTFRKSLRKAAEHCQGITCRNFPHDITDSATLMAYVESVNAASWSHAEGSSFVAAPTERDFVRRVIERFAAQGKLLASVLFAHDGSAVAFAFGVKIGVQVFGIKTGYQQVLDVASCGTHVMAQFVRLCIALGARSLDMDCVTTRGEYKRRWGSRLDGRACWRVFSDRTRGLIMGLLYDAARSLRSRLRT